MRFRPPNRLRFTEPVVSMAETQSNSRRRHKRQVTRALPGEQPVAVEVFGGQIQGERDRQEDSYRIWRKSGLIGAVLADGLGGHPCGEVASRLAVTEVVSKLSTIGATRSGKGIGASLGEAVKSAHLAVLQASQRKNGCAGMGTTLVSCVVAPSTARIWACAVGDSRILRISPRGISDLIYEDSLDDWGAAGGFVKSALGVNLPTAGPLVISSRVQPGERILLVSDGVETIEKNELADLCLVAKSAEDAVEGIIATINSEDYQYQDNATLVAMSFNSEAAGLNSNQRDEWPMSQANTS